MKIVIEIPEEMYRTVQDGTYCGSLYEELKNGTPLPKGHGRLIDGDYLYKKFVSNKCPDGLTLQFIKDEPTIIGADKESDGWK